jgi:hypothetical protein
MHFGGAMFFTDYSMSAPELARPLYPKDRTLQEGFNRAAGGGLAPKPAAAALRRYWCCVCHSLIAPPSYVDAERD